MMLKPKDREAIAWIIFLIVCLSLTSLLCGCQEYQPVKVETVKTPCAEGRCPLPIIKTPVIAPEMCDTK